MDTILRMARRNNILQRARKNSYSKGLVCTSLSNVLLGTPSSKGPIWRTISGGIIWTPSSKGLVGIPCILQRARWDTIPHRVRKHTTTQVTRRIILLQRARSNTTVQQLWPGQQSSSCPSWPGVPGRRWRWLLDTLACGRHTCVCLFTAWQ